MLNCLSPFQDESQHGHSVSDHADRGSEAAVRGGPCSAISHGCLCMLRSLSRDVWSPKALFFFFFIYLEFVTAKTFWWFHPTSATEAGLPLVTTKCSAVGFHSKTSNIKGSFKAGDVSECTDLRLELIDGKL